MRTTRHNAGFAVVDALASRQRLAWKTAVRFAARIARWDRADGRTCMLAKPQTFMNESGRAVRALADFYKLPPAGIIVVYDDLTIELGRVKVTRARQRRRPQRCGQPARAPGRRVHALPHRHRPEASAGNGPQGIRAGKIHPRRTNYFRSTISPPMSTASTCLSGRGPTRP